MGASLKCTDHNGKEYCSITEMCRHYGIDDRLYHNRRKKGYSVEESLTGRGIERIIKPCKDHLGNIFVSEKEMCRSYNISSETFRDRIRRGWMLEKALTQPPKSYKQPKNILFGDEHIGICRLMKCGLYAKIVSYADKNNVTIEFEDGEIVVGALNNFKAGNIAHPVLSHIKRNSEYLSFRVLNFARNEKGLVMECICNKCGNHEALYPMECVEHYKACSRE